MLEEGVQREERPPPVVERDLARFPSVDGVKRDAPSLIHPIEEGDGLTTQRTPIERVGAHLAVSLVLGAPEVVEERARRASPRARSKPPPTFRLDALGARDDVPGLHLEAGAHPRGLQPGAPLQMVADREGMAGHPTQRLNVLTAPVRKHKIGKGELLGLARADWPEAPIAATRRRRQPLPFLRVFRPSHVREPRVHSRDLSVTGRDLADLAGCRGSEPLLLDGAAHVAVAP